MEALLEATAQVLVKYDYKSTTTGRIAERAGVSIGSLYQYFPHRNALIAALVEQYSNSIVECVSSALDQASDLEIGLRNLVHAVLDTQRIDPSLHKVLMEQISNVDRLAEVMDTHRCLTAQIEAFLRQHSHRLAPNRSPALAALLVESALESAVHRAVLTDSRLLGDSRFGDELFDLLVGYVTGRSESLEAGK
ncbi:TetR/AcrR family transcriptional regulator [Allopusillimonas ginsengisoli]|uniref:TetR/AcrR family transcriptional regulator n=1 Tax=Allopusillimonas ginsengisoli TaxID=453575 RepID=UPI0010221BD4|nr:TetR/AcrR family transcriptional regulator [Allopusillimonas ginsengisoli]TEA71943.1 TetR/AcrR family transcriptional regulator [Allopusillimonas ginsengisoli]